MTARSVAEKMGVKPGWTAHFVHAPAGVPESMDLPDLELVDSLDGLLDYLHLFVTTQEQMRAEFPELVPHLAPQGKLWLSWPKGRRLGSDLTLPRVIEIGYDCGLVESTCLSIDETWSALRFTHPKPGTRYANSFGTLPGQR
ncbi:hypothetical protein [Aeromicrobium sp.]|uniref:hypothetical protein n=1 Tax=Aeromicrobium sp. TaxID=1871063 RepID=UPI0028B00D2A|nr:hypothetical protein [Aeromicrobium sp.]